MKTKKTCLNCLWNCIKDDYIACLDWGKVEKHKHIEIKPVKKEKEIIVYWCPANNSYMIKKCIGYDEIDCIKLCKDCNKKFKLVEII